RHFSWARRLHAAGKMTDAVMDLALNANERDFLMAGIALRAGVPLWGVERIVDGQSARGVTALRWKAGIPMRFAIELQRRLARIPPSKVIHARDGVQSVGPRTRRIFRLGRHWGHYLGARRGGARV
ncbi:MAG: DUF2336 domain-containing protein, partial [Bacteroidetes bacterium]|nr:DUF2336 domain-containing protein [Bacteroidota bacterium]